MRNVIFSFSIAIAILFSLPVNIIAQDSSKKEISTSERAMIKEIFEKISQTDQLYRNPLAK
ncbi:MAG: hypothetical protein AAFO82_17180, partial [Bacteroidota bacterium]